jgi:exopolysaccharide production protein ExoY
VKYKNFSHAPAGTNTIAPASTKRSHYAMWGKRTFDLTLATLALPVVLIVYAVVWVLNIGSKQKMVFSQARVGKDGQVFMCFKLQTMVNDAEQVLADMCEQNPDVKAEWDEFQKLEKDPRITKVGKFLRRTSLDELPQVFNVLRGDMSIVGPRPFIESQNDLYISGGGTHYFAMKPGITGNWQVEGRGNTSFLSRISYDRLYFSKTSLFEDLRLVGRTVKVLLKMSGR